MNNPSVERGVSQLLVLGRGVEPVGAEYPGSLQPNSAVSSDGYDRAVFAAQYALRQQPELIVFSGRSTFAMPDALEPLQSEAEAGLAVAHQHGLGSGAYQPRIVAERDSRSTYENYLNSRRFFDPSRAVGVVAQKDHMERALFTGHMVMPDIELVPLVVPNSENRPMNLNRRDGVAVLLYKLAMRGVEPGDVDTIRARDQLVQRNVRRALALPHYLAAQRAKETPRGNTAIKYRPPKAG